MCDVCVWAPIKGTALEFYGRLRWFHDNFWRHQWELDHANIVSKLYERKYYNQAWLKPPLILGDHIKTPKSCGPRIAKEPMKRTCLPSRSTLLSTLSYAGPRKILMYVDIKERSRLGLLCKRLRIFTCDTSPFDKVTGILIKDFAARLSVPRKLTKTCASDPSYHEWVGVLQLNPRLVYIPKSVRNRRRKKINPRRRMFSKN